MSVKIASKLPWRAKLGLKLVLSRLPLGYGCWQRIGVFRHGRMDDPEYAFDVFRGHLESANLLDRFPMSILEIGPGDSLLSALLGFAHHASRTYLVDVGSWARTDPAPYSAMIEFLATRGYPVPDAGATASLEALLEASRASYLTEGLRSLQRLPSESVDFVFSQAVLEHVRRREFLPMMKELRRILRPGGTCSHQVDLRDHLGGGLNNLRFSPTVWESDLFYRSGFYTNRLRFSEMIDLFADAGFEVDAVRAERWEELPTPRAKLYGPYRDLPERELLVSNFDIVLSAA